MRFCKYCGAQVADDAEECPECGKTIGTKVSTNENPKSSDKFVSNEIKARLNKRNALLLIIFGVIVAIIVLVVVNSGKCKASGCNNKAVSGMDYCYTHKCAITSCNNKKINYSNYCSTHSLLYDDDIESSYKPSVYSYELKISDVKISSNSSYTVAEGTITNNSDQTVRFVEIKGSFKNSSGEVIDTDWTYAVGSEGLEPGETSKWRMSVKKDSSIKDCAVAILDFDY